MRSPEIQFRMKKRAAPAEEKAICLAASVAREGALLFCLCATLLLLSGCGGSSSSSNNSSGGAQIAGNWQFTMTPPSDGSFLGGIQGGFLLQNNNSVTGSVVYN